MSRREGTLLALTALVLALCVGYGARVSKRAGVRAELREAKIASVTEETAARLAALEGDVLLSYYVTARERMPARMKGVQEGVVLVLEAMKRASDGKLDYQVLDPADDPEFEAWLDALGVAPYTTRRVERDGYVEREIWSTLHVAYGARPTAQIRAIGPEHLPHLLALVLAHLDQLEAPRQPLVAVDGPEALARVVGERARVQEVDFDADPTLPDNADVFFWVAPRTVTPAHLAALSAFTESGRSVVVAGSRIRAVPASPPGAMRLEDTGYPAEVLLGEFGLRPLAGFALDTFCASPPPEGGVDELRPEPFRIRCIAPNQDFRAFLGQPNGSLLFETPTPFELDGARLAAIGRRATLLATTSNQSWVDALPARPFVPGELTPTAEDLGAKHALGVLLESDDPARGAIVFLAAASPFSGTHFHREGFAHRALVDILLATLASDERLAIHRASFARRERLAALAPTERALWRGVTSFLVPAMIAGFALARGAFRRGGRSSGRTGVPVERFALACLGGVVGAALLAALAPRGRVDLTRDGLHALAPGTHRVLDRLDADAPITLQLAFSAESRLPPELRPLVRRARELATELAYRSPAVLVAGLDPEAEDLASLGIEPVQVTSTFDEVTTVRRVTSAIRVVGLDWAQVLPLSNAASFEDLEFRLALALSRTRPHVAVACDVPRLTPAEAQLEYQNRGLFAPTGGDVYGQAREALGRDDLRVTFVDPARPVLPGGIDLLVWLQPRRDARPLLKLATDYLADGGDVVLALQHFEVVPKTFDEGERTEWWPQPQYPDVDALYLAPLGVELVREVLFDELSTPPFRIRAVAENRPALDRPHATFTAGLGDLSFPSGNRIRWDATVLAQRGIRAQPLIRTSERAWSFPWQGGVLDPRALTAPGAGSPPPGTSDWRFLAGKQPLAVLFEGRFPRFDPTAQDSEPALVEVPGGRAGRLLVVGSSKMFRNGHLADGDFRHDHFLLNAAAALTLDEGLAEILGRRPVRRGFDYVSPEARLRWRAFVLGTAPALLVSLTWLFRLARRRKPPEVRA